LVIVVLSGGTRKDFWRRWPEFFSLLAKGLEPSAGQSLNQK
jgi:hypothetical protein